MKDPIKFGANFAVIGGKRVPYSLLGAVAAILGAVLIWAQFKNSGGIALGGQSPDLSTLTDALGGGSSGGGMDASASQNSAVALGATAPAPQGYSYYVPSLSAPTPIYTGYAGALASAAPEPAAIGANPALATSGGSYGGQMGSVQAFAPIAPSLGGLLPGILTPAMPTSRVPAAVAGPSLISGIQSRVSAVAGAPTPPNLIPGKTGGVTKF